MIIIINSFKTQNLCNVMKPVSVHVKKQQTVLSGMHFYSASRSETPRKNTQKTPTKTTLAYVITASRR